MNIILSDIPLLTAIARNIENLSLKSEKIFMAVMIHLSDFFPLGPSTLMPLHCIKQKWTVRNNVLQIHYKKGYFAYN